MTFTATRPVQKASYTTGVSVYMRKRKDGACHLTFTLSAKFQDDNFDGSIEGEFLQLTYGSGPDSGTVKLAVTDEKQSTMFAVNSMKGAVRFSCMAWAALGNEPRKSEHCKVISADKGTLLIKLPDWANGQEKLKNELGLQPTTKAT